MKQLIYLFIFAAVVSSCGGVSKEKYEAMERKYDAAMVDYAWAVDSMKKVEVATIDSMKRINKTQPTAPAVSQTTDCVSLKAERDKLRTSLTRANLKVIRIKFYVGLANKNPKKYNGFLRGWINGIYENQGDNKKDTIYLNTKEFPSPFFVIIK